MWSSRLLRQLPRRNLYSLSPIPDKTNLKEECNRFVISMSTVIIFSSILWGFESFREKKKYIQFYQEAVDNFYFDCLKDNNFTNSDCLKFKSNFEKYLYFK